MVYNFLGPKMFTQVSRKLSTRKIDSAQNSPKFLVIQKLDILTSATLTSQIISLLILLILFAKNIQESFAAEIACLRSNCPSVRAC